MKIEWVTTTRQPCNFNAISGGIAYDCLAIQALRTEFDTDVVWVKKDASHNLYQKVANEYSFIKKLLQLNLRGDIIIRTNVSVALVPFQKGISNIAILHQFYKRPTFSAYYIPSFFRNLKRVDAIVTVSKYWYDWFPLWVFCQ